MKPLSPEQRKVILAFADNDMNTTRTARKMGYHRNSVLYNLQKVHEITSLDPRHFHDLVKLVDFVERG